MGKLPPNGLALLKQLLKMSPNERISAQEALRHPYFDGLREDDLRRKHSLNNYVKKDTNTCREANNEGGTARGGMEGAGEDHRLKKARRVSEHRADPPVIHHPAFKITFKAKNSKSVNRERNESKQSQGKRARQDNQSVEKHRNHHGAFNAHPVLPNYSIHPQHIEIIKSKELPNSIHYRETTRIAVTQFRPIERDAEDFPGDEGMLPLSMMGSQDNPPRRRLHPVVFINDALNTRNR